MQQTSALWRPNLFELTGSNVQVTYSTSSIIGRPQLHYRNLRQNIDRSFHGDQIRTLETELGTLVTVTIEAVPDRRRVLLTLLVPTIQLEDRQASFNTHAILTTERTPFGGRPTIVGPVQRYRLLRLRGLAQRVDFAAGETSKGAPAR